MDAATLEEVLELAARARELEERGQFWRAADKLSSAADLADRGAPPDCLIAPSLRLELLKALSAHAQCAAVPLDEGMAVEKRVLDDELPLLVGVLERRRASGTLLPGACRPAEEEWYRQHLVRRSEAGCDGGGAVSDETARAFGPLVGYATLLGAAALAVTKLELAVQRRRPVTDLLRAHCTFVEAAADALQQRVHPTTSQLCPIAEAQLVAQLGRVADVPVPALAVHELGRRLCVTWHTLLDSHVAAQRGLDSLRSQAEQREAARVLAAQQALERGLRRCGLAGCGAREAAPGGFSLCAACKGPAYCGKEHQVQAWPDHKRDCKAARKAAEAAAPAAIAAPPPPPPKGRRK